MKILWEPTRSHTILWEPYKLCQYDFIMRRRFHLQPVLSNPHAFIRPWCLSDHDLVNQSLKMIRSVVSRVFWPLRCQGGATLTRSVSQSHAKTRAYSSVSTSHREIWGEGSDDYKGYLAKREKVLDTLLNGPKRFQRISERQDRSDVPIEAMKADCMGRYFITHRGCQVMKGGDDLTLLQLLLWYLRPATVIELGTFTGGSAVWYSDMMRMMGIESQVYSMDVTHSNIEDRVKEIKPDNVTFLLGDSNAIEKTFTKEFLNDLPHPWLISEDSHTNIYGIMEYFNQFMRTNDYFVVEDLSPIKPQKMGVGRINPEYKLAGSYGLDVLKKFLSDYEDSFAVDSFYTDLFGYNGTWNWHGFIRKM